MEPVLTLNGPLTSVSVVSSGMGAPSRGGGADQAVSTRDSEAEKARSLAAATALLDAAARLDAWRRELPAKIESQLVDLAVGIARKVLCQELQAGRYEIEPIVREALAGLDLRAGAVVHLNAEDLRRGGLAPSEGDADQAVRYVADPQVAPGECFVETPEGTVEATVEHQLARVSEEFKGAVLE
ncbi:MAG: FliH/SctL family protein [Planctomycetota bacterium]|nr:FliH/SctL family protein [Planctomycetota bacterium]